MSTDSRVSSHAHPSQEHHSAGHTLPVEEAGADCYMFTDSVAGRLRVLATQDILLSSVAATAILAKPKAQAAAAPAEQAGRFRLLGEIARGGMGAVLRAHDPELGRDVAIKIILPEQGGHPTVLRRFLDEARLAGQLQHPGIAPVYDLGQLPDGRPFFAMKLIAGRTLAKLLAERADPSRDLPRFVQHFAAICQTVAYAHAQRIIHRDLKPLNVMVGAFGEVQVMDWGLAKRLQNAEDRMPKTDESSPPASAEQSQPGSVVGTPAYMPPEQALGQAEQVDAQSDVFALGSLLCEILTGKPAYRGATFSEVYQRAADSDLADAWQRLDGCGADAELVQLAKACMAVAPAERPADGAAVAARVAAYQDGVQQRLRQAEVARAQAQVRAEEERKRRRVQLGLAAAVLVLVLVGGGGVWLIQQQRQARAADVVRQRQQADDAARQAMTEARLLLAQAQTASLWEASRFTEALSVARKAAELARTGTASAEVQQQAVELVEVMEREATAARRDRELLVALLEVRGPREWPTYQIDERGLMMQLTIPSADEQFAAAFRSWGLDVDRVATAEAAARLRARPTTVQAELIAALDEWASERRRLQKAAAKSQRLTDLANALDDPGSRRRELRILFVRGNLERERVLAMAGLVLRPVPVPFGPVLGEDRARLRRLAFETNPNTEPVLGLLTLVNALCVAGEEVLAERSLRTAVRARPQEVVLYQTLGQLVGNSAPPRWAEAVEFYMAARALRPSLGDALANALIGAGRQEEGLALYKQLAEDNPNNPWIHLRRGYALDVQGRYKEAEAAFRAALRLKPDYPEAHVNLGNALDKQGRYKEAEAAYREALRLKPDDPLANYSLGYTLFYQSRFKEAEAAYRETLRLQSDHPGAQSNLGNALGEQSRFKEAEEVLREAVRRKPDLAVAHYNLGYALAKQGRYKEAEAACREAIRIKPDFPNAHINLGSTLHAQGRYKEAEAAYREAVRLKPDSPLANYNLGLVLGNLGRYKEAEAAFRAALRLAPDYAAAHHNLGNALFSQLRYKEAEAAYREALRLKPNYTLAKNNLRSVERIVELDQQLPAVLKGDTQPANPAEHLEFASLCQHPAKRLHAAAVRLCAAGFVADPKLADDLAKGFRYKAACSAALAAAGQATDAKSPPDKLAQALRQQALQWLRADLALSTKLAERDGPAKESVQKRLVHWQTDVELAGVRDAAALASLSEAERDDWRRLWADADALLRRISGR